MNYKNEAAEFVDSSQEFQEWLVSFYDRYCYSKTER